MAVYDDDEEDRPIGFEQDPDEDELGHGTWIYADGTRAYSKGDPEVAKALLKKAPLTSAGAGLAGAGPDKPKTSPLTDEERAPLQASKGELDRLGAGLAGERPLTPEERFLQTETGAEADAAAEASEHPKSLGGANPEPASPPSPGAPSPPGLRPPALPGAAGPARFTDRSEASSSTTGSAGQSSSSSVTRSAQSQADFDAQQNAIGQSYGEQIDAAGQGAQSQADAILARRNALIQMAQDKEAATTAAMAQREQRAARATQAIKDRAARPIDHNKMWKDKGALGTTLGLLGVALRSITATKFGGPNTALQSIQEQRKQNIQAQMDDRDSELRGLEKELGSLEAAVPVLEARMRDAEIKRIDGMLANEKSQEVLANGEKLKGQLATERDAKLAEASKAYFGTLSTQEAQQSQVSRTEGQAVSRDRLSGAGVGDTGKGKSASDLYDDMLERDKKMEERGATPEERKAMWDRSGFSMPSGESAPARTNREQEEKVARDEENMNEDQSKAESGMALLDQWGTDAGLVRDPKTKKWVEPGGFGGTVKPGWDEGVRGLAGQATPATDSRRAAVQGVGRFLSGSVIGEDEGKEFEALIGDESASRNQIASRLNRMETLVNERRKAKFKQKRNDPRNGPRGKEVEAP